MSLRFVLILLCASAVIVSDAVAQLPSAQLTSLNPPGARIGTTLEIEARGDNLDALRSLTFSHPSIRATPVVKEPQPGDPHTHSNRFRVAVGESVPAGFYEARVAGRFGVSNPRSFAVGRLPESLIREKNDDFATAAAASVGHTFNGIVPPETRKFFKVALDAGQRVFVDCAAQRIDSRLNAALVLFDREGRELARANDVLGLDPLLDFTAPHGGEYFLALYDFLYRGGNDYYYRLTIHEGPHVDFLFPPAVRPDSAADITVYGRELPGGVASDLTVHGQPLQKLVLPIRAPSNPFASAPPAAASPAACWLDTFQPDVDFLTDSVLYFAHADVIAEQEPNDDADRAQAITAPCEIAGQFYPARDVDIYELQAQRGELFFIDVLAHRLSQDVDPRLYIEKIVTTGDGKTKSRQAANVDDSRTRAQRIGGDFDTSTDDPAYRLAVDEDALYRIQVWDQFGGSKSDPRRVYRLVIRRARPDFRLLAVPLPLQTPPNPNAIALGSPCVRQGGAAIFRIDAERSGGFDGEIEIAVEGLPEGVRCRGTVIRPGATTADLVLEAAPDAPAWSGTLQVTGTAEIDGTVIRPARGGAVVWGTANRQQDPPTFRGTRDIAFAVIAEPAVAAIGVGELQTFEAARGGSVEIPLSLNRRRGFKGDLKLVCQGLPNELKQDDITIKGDTSEAKLPVAITNTKAKPGVYWFYLRGDARTKLVRDAAAVDEAQRRSDQLAEQITELEAGAAQAANAPQQGGLAAELETARLAKAAADKHLKEVKKANAPRDLNFAVLSPPIRLQVAESPLSMEKEPAAQQLVAGSKDSQPVKVARKFGFDGKITLTADIPRGVAGLKLEPLTIEESQHEGEITFSAAADATPGTHQIVLHFRGKLNKIDFDTTRTITVTVNAK